MYIFGRMFWGLLLVLVGILFILRNFAGLNIPIGGIVWPVIIIFIGLSILSRPRRLHREYFRHSEKDVVFDQAKVEINDDEQEYSTVFGKGSFDLTKIKVPAKGVKKVKVSAVFGSAELKIDQKTPLKIKATGVFGGVHLPDGTTSSFSEHYYVTKAYKEKFPYIFVEANAVFGGIDVID